MNVPVSVKPAIFGAIAGAIAAMIVGFAWGGWVTGGTAQSLAAETAEGAIVQTFTPLCVIRAQEDPQQLALLKDESRWARRSFVIEAGWVNNVNEKYRSAVATECASVAVEAME